MLTNQHVIDGCGALVGRVSSGNPFDLDVVATDKANDLALLRAPASPRFASFRRDATPLGEPVTVFGYPLAGTLAVTGNLTTGTVSGLAGIGNDPTKLQISAPVQAGNSGGAVLDESGTVLGVVVSKLDVVKAAPLIGDLPQNVNFAIKASVARNFLEANGVQIHERAAKPRKVKDIAEEATRFTALVACFK